MSSIYSGKNQISGGGSSGGDALTVNGHTVESDVPENAVFTDTVYDDTELSDRVNSLNYAQKTVNTELDHCFCMLSENYIPVVGEYVPFIIKEGNVKSDTTGLFKLKGNHTYQISFVLAYTASDDQSIGMGAANVLYYCYDKTNDIKIMRIEPNFASPKYELPYTYVFQYTPTTDCEIGLKVDNIYVLDILLNYYTSLGIQEIGRDITIDPLDYVNTETGIEDTPVGYIISYMGNNAPKHYLPCDGTEYNITDYPYLSEHIKTEFGSYNYFGGDGTTTFAVPDLRGEFLRGTSIATRNTGSGADVGVHQDATDIPFFRNLRNIDNLVQFRDNSTGSVAPSNMDTTKTGTGFVNIDATASGSNAGNTHPYSYTSRPTNTSVLYCIKYEPTYFMKNTIQYIGFDETVLWDGSILINHAADGIGSNLNKNITLADNISNYSTIVFKYQLYSTSNSIAYNNYQKTIFTDMFNSTSCAIKLDILWNFTFVDNVVYVSDNKILINTSYTENTSKTSADAIKLCKIVGIKSKKIASDSSAEYTDEEIKNAVANILGGE